MGDGTPSGARVNLSVPAALLATVRAELPGLNLSRTFQEAIADRLNCPHEALQCALCAKEMSPEEIATAALSAFFTDVMRQFEDLVYRGGTAEGAARVLRDRALRHGVKAAANHPLPRPSRRMRELHRAAQAQLDQDQVER